MPISRMFLPVESTEETSLNDVRFLGRHTPLGYCLSMPPWGIASPMNTATKTAVAKRLARIEGQVRGLSVMVEKDRYCLDVVTQVRAARAALAKIEQIVLQDHLGSCVESAIASGDPEQQRQKVAELINVFSKSDR